MCNNSKEKLMNAKSVLVFAILLSVVSCVQETSSNAKEIESSEEHRDTVVIKHKNVLNKSYQVGFYSKSYSYYWVAGKDTLDFHLSAAAHEKDSSLHLNIHHKGPLLFTDVLRKIKECLPIIEEDFDLSKLSSLNFRSPIYYLDLAKELSSEYEQEFGQKNISYETLDLFLLKTKLNLQLDKFLAPLNKRVQRYGIEKFHLLNKKYYSSYLPGIDLAAYPEFTIGGMGVYVRLADSNNAIK